MGRGGYRPGAGRKPGSKKGAEELRQALVNIAKSLRTIKNSNNRCKSIHCKGRGAKNRTKCNRYNDKYRKCPA